MPRERPQEIDPFRKHRVKIARMKAFIIEIFDALGEDSLCWSPYIKEIIEIALMLESIRAKIRANIYESTLTAFIYVMKSRGLVITNTNKLISQIKKKLSRRIARGRIIILLNYLKKINTDDYYEETKRLILSLIYKLSSDTELLRRLIKYEIDIDTYLTELRNVSIGLLKEFITIDYKNKDSRKSKSMIAALCVYLADKKIANRAGYRSILSARIIEKYLGISQFTILRQYKTFLDIIWKGDAYNR